MLIQRFREFFSALHTSPEDSPSEETETVQLHRLDPLLFLNLFEALTRYDSELANHLADRLGVSREGLLELASESVMLGPGQLGEVLNALDHHPRYGDIMNLAGRNCYSMQCVRDGELRRQPLSLLARRIGQRLLPLLGDASLEIDIKGRVLMLRITNSIFAEGRFSLNCLCGFYVGWLQQLGHETGMRGLDAKESSCACQDEDERSCLIQVAT